MRREKWKGVVLCTKHGARLCTQIHGPRNTSEPTLVKVDGTDVTDFSWACKGLFTKTKIDLTSDKIKFVSYCSSSDLYKKKYTALGIETGRKGMGRVDPKMHLVLGESRFGHN